MREEDYNGALERLDRAKDAIGMYAATFDANIKAGIYGPADISRINGILRDYDLWVDTIDRLRDPADDWAKNHYFGPIITYDSENVPHSGYPNPFQMLRIYFSSFAWWTDVANPSDTFSYMS